ncbi:MAG: twin-arginine translocase subunit TatC [Pantoea sp. Brub]|nr:twin-arginine translocase subunit TatC [Pantoea sp. Brub]
MNENNTQSIIFHIIELRKSLLRCIMTVLIIFCILLYFANDIYNIIAMPLISYMPSGTNMLAINITSPFIVPIKLTFFISLIIAIPIIIYQIWVFIAPGLYTNERNVLIPIIIIGTSLFYLGLFVAYFIILPMSSKFFIHTAPKQITVATDIANYLDFVINLFISFGIAFETPIIIVLLCWTGLTNCSSLKKQRPYILIILLIIATLLTPPDIFSQILLTTLMYCLFEFGILFSSYFLKKNIIVTK